MLLARQGTKANATQLVDSPATPQCLSPMLDLQAWKVADFPVTAPVAFLISYWLWQASSFCYVTPAASP